MKFSEIKKRCVAFQNKFLKKKNVQTIVFGFAINAFVLFVVFVVFIISKMDYHSGNVLVELVKISQLVLFIAVVVYFAKKVSPWLAVLLGAFFVWVQLIFTLYFSFTKKRLDFSFFSRNKENILDVTSPYWMRLLILFLFSLVVGYFFYKLDLELKSKRRLTVFIACLVIVFSFPLFGGERYLNEVFFFAKSSYVQDAVVESYQKKYDELLVEAAEKKQKIILEKESLKNKEVPKYLENIIFLQLESLNGRLINEENSPNFFTLAEEGVLFDSFYGNSVQTILGQESMLCSLPSSFQKDLVSSGRDQDVLCLPELLSVMGYDTSFFKTYSLEFENTRKFMSNIGFEQLHDYDIMKKDDPQYIWGFKEDIFYERVFSYIRENQHSKRNLFFLEVGPTNHWPFETTPEYQDEAPFKEPKNHLERLTNTTFLQDRHLAIAWEEIQKTFPEKNYTVVILGDHSWPHGEHINNEFCVSGSFEENFQTAMVVIFGDGSDNELKGKVVSEKHSQMDILPSFAKLLGVDLQNNQFQKDLFDEKNEDKKIILVQPFLDKTLNFVSGSSKFQYKIRDKEFVYFDLKGDPEERNKIFVTKGDKSSAQIIDRKFYFFRSDER